MTSKFHKETEQGVNDISDTQISGACCFPVGRVVYVGRASLRVGVLLLTGLVLACPSMAEEELEAFIGKDGRKRWRNADGTSRDHEHWLEVPCPNCNRFCSTSLGLHVLA
eukprot:g80996.t1